MARRGKWNADAHLGQQEPRMPQWGKAYQLPAPPTTTSLVCRNHAASLATYSLRPPTSRGPDSWLQAGDNRCGSLVQTRVWDPRQLRKAVDMEAGEEAPAMDTGLAERESAPAAEAAAQPELLAQPEAPSPSGGGCSELGPERTPQLPGAACSPGQQVRWPLHGPGLWLWFTHCAFLMPAHIAWALANVGLGEPHCPPTATPLMVRLHQRPEEEAEQDRPGGAVPSPAMAAPWKHSGSRGGRTGLPKGSGSWRMDSARSPGLVSDGERGSLAGEAESELGKVANAVPGTDTESPPPPPPPQPSPSPPGGPEESGGQELDTQPEEDVGTSSAWSGPDELELVLQEDGQRCLRARSALAEGFAWGPFQGSIQSGPSSPRQEHLSPPLTLQLDDEACWLKMLPQATTEAEANLLIYKKDDALWCRTTKPVPPGGLLRGRLEPKPHRAPSPPRKREPGEVEGQAPANSDIQLLPQQAGMASILATAVINKDIFPCKDCGIWYRSERNLQAHLLYYCASRQGAGSPAPEEKAKETYPNERVCPFPQCRKSCPSASSLEIHMRSHSGERPFVCLICLSAFTTKANCERHLKVHTDTLSGVCHSCGFISTTRDILYSHLVTSHMICQPGSKGELYAPSAGYPAAKPPADSLVGFPQHTALHGALASTDLAPIPSPGLERKAPAETTNGEAWAASQNGNEAPPVHRSIKVEAEEEPEAAQSSPAPGAPSRTPSPSSPPAVRVKTERSSPSPACSPAPGELGVPAGPLFLPQFVFGPDTVPQASEILAKMSELVHSRLKQGQGTPGLFTGAPAPKGATCFECEITFNNVNNYYVHKRLYCSGRHLTEDAPAARRPKGPPAAPAPGPTPPEVLQSPPPPTPEGDAGRSPQSPEAREAEAGAAGARAHAATPEAEAASRGSEGSQSPGSSVDDAEDDPSRTLCEACNIRFSRHETYTVHKRYYCASRHDPPPRRPGPGAPPPMRTRRRRKLYELHAPGAPAPTTPGPAHPVPAEPPTSPRPGSGSGRAPSPVAAAEGPIDLSKKPRRQGPEGPAGPPPLADYHECTACRVSFHSLEAYLAHKKFSCPAVQLRAAVVCPYCPPNGLVRGDLVQHLRRAHGLLLGRAPVGGPGAPEAQTPPTSPALHGSRESLNGQEPAASSPQPGPPTPPTAAPDHSLSPVPDPLLLPPLTPPAHSDKGVQTPSKGPPAPVVSSGNHRYCRLCNIKFSSLSTFIAHKKYYCSSHAAEHVK
ncbi:PREDICTED: zinc finger protein ZFPM1 [Elephantulus edwardii]|uniref:zinc finger protein ZFPM1 n=1 Tax=Elephantulus edwardii TaxID=28737 RepID=UPI0003F0A04E|nr:PREDICTED: zinc finger protein ZFPM1 [Elephantulus edwardii]